MMSTPNVSEQTPFSIITADRAQLRDYLLDLCCRFAYQEGEFVLSSGLASSYYVNGKQITLHPQGAVAIARLLLPLLPTGTQAVAGLTLGADPIVTAVSVVATYEQQVIPPLIVRKQPKGHGTQSYIEGMALPAGSLVVVLEDVVTTGASALQAVDRLQAAGYRVEQILALVDRQQGGAELYQSRGLKFRPLFTIQDIQHRWATLKEQGLL
jgi:orotate phosphoribosyltransferase